MHRRNFMRTPRFLLGMGVEILGWMSQITGKNIVYIFSKALFS